jgi:hypothetical protein
VLILTILQATQKARRAHENSIEIGAGFGDNYYRNLRD